MRIAVVGLGRIGSWSAKELAPTLSLEDELVLVDRDIIEESNLGGCAFYEKNNLGEFKARAVQRRLLSMTEVGLFVFEEHLSKQNISEMLVGCKLVLDCTDNWQTRILLNEFCWKNHVPWAYAGALGSHGMVSTIIPGETPCFACWANKPAATLSCSEIGVDRKVVQKIAEKQVSEARLIKNNAAPALAGKIFYYNGLVGESTIINTSKNNDCAFCVRGDELVEEEQISRICGSGEWQFLNSLEQKNIEKIFSKMEGVKRKKIGRVVKAYLGGTRALVFESGRIVVKAKQENDAIAANELILQKIS